MNVHGLLLLRVVLLFLVVALGYITTSVQALSSRKQTNGACGPPQQQQHPQHSAPERTVVILYHKPVGVLTTHASDDGRPTVYDQVTALRNMKGSSTEKNTKRQSFAHVTGIRSKLHAIGRLDVDTSGVLLLTNDGGLVHHVTNPTASTHHNDSGPIAKSYQALIMGHHDERTLQAFVTQGVDIGAKYGGWTKPVRALHILDHPTPKSTVVSITIEEGKNRQVRRMFHAVGSGVMKLTRTHIGSQVQEGESSSLTLDGLAEGEWRLLAETEIQEHLHWTPRVIESSAGSSRISRRSTAGTRTRPTGRRRKRKGR